MTARDRRDLQPKVLRGLRYAPVAVSFRDRPPAKVERVARSAPAGCSYWLRAARGEVFYTEAADHLGCAIGAHTHAVSLPDSHAAELRDLLREMIGLGYLQRDEIAAIPRLRAPFRVAVYAPFHHAPCRPDAVIVRGNAREIMLFSEAARAAGLPGAGIAIGRPTCAAIPATLAGGCAHLSQGCIGNRIYNHLGDDESYLFVPGSKWRQVVRALRRIEDANARLASLHRSRRNAARKRDADLQPAPRRGRRKATKA